MIHKKDVILCNYEGAIEFVTYFLDKVVLQRKKCGKYLFTIEVRLGVYRVKELARYYR